MSVLPVEQFLDNTISASDKTGKNVISYAMDPDLGKKCRSFDFQISKRFATSRLG